MIYTVTLNPSIDRALTVERFQVGGTFKAARSDLLPAGKGINVARVIATLGEPVAALGLVGENDLPAFATALAEAHIENRLVSVAGSTRASVTILDPIEGTQTHVREPGNEPPESAVQRIETDLAGTTAEDWVVFAGSLPSGLATDTYYRFLQLCAGRGARTLLDASGPPLPAGVRALPAAVRLNLYELWQVDGRSTAEQVEQELDGIPLSQVLSAARRVQGRGVSMVVVSMGERGVLGLDPGGGAWHAQTTLDRPVVDAVGSGDALGGGWVVGMVRGASFPEALRLGVACGAANTLVVGAGCCRKSDIERLAARARVCELL
jgi:1-phosphofructokinase family hexose kinase